MKHRKLMALVATGVFVGSTFLALPSAFADDDVNVVPDPVLRQCIAYTMHELGTGASPGQAGYANEADSITKAKLQALANAAQVVGELQLKCIPGQGALDANSPGVASLEGLQYLNSPVLTVVDIEDGTISDLGPVSGLNPYIFNFSGNDISDLKPLAQYPAGYVGYLILDFNKISDFSVLPRLCTQAQQAMIYSGPGTDCVALQAAGQELTADAVSGSPVSLPVVKGQSDDPVTWSVLHGDATINSDGTITYSGPGTYTLSFHDTSSGAVSLDLGVSDPTATSDHGKADCSYLGGTWDAAKDTGSPDATPCHLTADLFGHVTVTVTGSTVTSSSKGMSANTGGSAVNAVLPMTVAGLLVLTGFVVVGLRRRV